MTRKRKKKKEPGRDIQTKTPGQFARDQAEFEKIRLDFCGSKKLEDAVKKLSQLTGWGEHVFWRYPEIELHDEMRLMMGEKMKSDRRKERARYLFNNGMKWPEVAEVVDGSSEGWNSLRMEVKRHCDENELFLRTGKPGSPPKPE